MGQVFGSIEEFVQAYLDDDSDNVATQQVSGSAFVWLVDRTPQTNGIWRLFERLEGGGARYLLCHSAGYWNQDPFRTLADPVVLDESLQPHAATERVSYEFSSVRGYYVPTRCVTRVVVAARPEAEAAECRGLVDPGYSVVDVPWNCGEHVFRCD